jgi:DNA-binding CsgD family transcriptional regulator
MADQWIAGRSEERILLLDALRHGSFASITGRPGSGKTQLMRWVCGETESDSVVLHCTPAAIESTIAASALSEIISRLAPDHLSQLADGHFDVLVDISRGTDIPDHSSVRAAFDGLLAVIADRNSVVVVLDDVQWIDSFSAEILAYALRRNGRHIPVIAASRSGTRSLLLDALGTRGDVVKLTLGPMSVDELAEIAARELGGASPICLTVALLAQGSPLRARELARMNGHNRDGLLAAEHIDAESNPFGPAVELLSLETAEVLFAALSLSEARIETLVALFGNDTTTITLDHLVARRFIRIVGQLVYPDHPLIVDAVTAHVSALTRAELNGRLAQVVTDPVERARHLSQSNAMRTKDIAAEILAGSQIAARQGSLVLAHQLALRVPSFLPPDAIDERFRAQLWLSSTEFIDDDYTGATLRLNRLIDSTPPGPAHTDALLALANIEAWGNDPIGGYLRYAALLADDATTVVAAAQAAVQLAILELAGGTTASAHQFAQRGHRYAVQIGGQLLAEAEAILAATGFFVGNGLDHELLNRALEREDTENPLSYQGPPLQWAPFLWLWSGDNRALEGFRRRRDIGLRRGATTTVSIGLSSEIHLLLERGRTDEAAIIVQRAVAIAQYESPMSAAMASLGEARYLAHTDSSSSQRVLSLLDDAEQMLDATGFGFGRIESHAIRIAELARTDSAAAAAFAIECLDRFHAVGMGDLGLMQGLLDAVEALVVTSHPDGHRLLTLLDNVDAQRIDLTMAKRWRDCCILATTGPAYPVEAVDALYVDWLASGDIYWAARSLVLSARVMRRVGQRRDSSERFGRALELFTHIGARAWADTVVAEAMRDGRPRNDGLEALTGNELRVAQLAAGGATNRNIAQAMFISEKTVEAALTAAYRKLHVARRSQLHLALTPPD